jgi:hypothetical protein
MEEGCKVGQTPPGLQSDGSFETPAGVRAYSIVSDYGSFLTVDKLTGVLVEEDSDER